MSASASHCAFCGRIHAIRYDCQHDARAAVRAGGRVSAIDHSARVAFFTAAGRRADELRHAIDPAAMPATTCEWTTWLVASLGRIAESMSDEDLEASLVDQMAGCLLWADDLERERRAA